MIWGSFSADYLNSSLKYFQLRLWRTHFFLTLSLKIHSKIVFWAFYLRRFSQFNFSNIIWGIKSLPNNVSFCDGVWQLGTANLIYYNFSQWFHLFHNLEANLWVAVERWLGHQFVHPHVKRSLMWLAIRYLNFEWI